MTTMPALASIADLIECRANYRDGRPHIAGTGISVSGIGLMWQQGYIAEEIAYEKSITLEQTCAALAYYCHNRAIIDADTERDDRENDRIEAEYHRRGQDPAVFGEMAPRPPLPNLASISDLIESRPGYHGGRPHIAGTGISIGRIGMLWKQGFGVGEIAYQKSITFEQACAALTHYLHNQVSIDADLKAQDEETDRIAAEYARQRGRLG